MSKPLTPEQMREWLDRKPPSSNTVGLCTSCGSTVAACLASQEHDGWCCADCRAVPGCHVPWRSWFADDKYLGERSARTGPDAVQSAQHCDCKQCVSGESK